MMEFLITGIMAVLLQSVTCGTVQTKMVFEAFSYGDDTAYQLYMGDGVSTQNGSNVHFKDPLVNMWGNQTIVHKVTLAIVDKLEEKAFVVFNGTGTDKITWMKQERILNSSYTDISNETANFFGIEGSPLGVGKDRRAFYMNKAFNGCEKDAGWIQVLVGKGYCPWEITASGSVTLVSYIPQSTAGVWHSDAQHADSMRIYIEYEEIPGSSTNSSSSSSSSTGRKTSEKSSKSSGKAKRKTTTSTTALIKDKEITGPYTSTSSSSSSSSERMITEPSFTSTVSTVSAEETPTSSTTLLRDITCPTCAPCGINQQVDKNMSLSELKEAVEQLKNQLRIDKTKLSSTIRSLTSAVDKRPSATAVGGLIGGAITAAIFGAIVLPDIISLCHYI